MISKENLSKITKYVLSEYPKEAVVGVKNEEVYYFKNIHPTPEDQFKVDSLEYMRVKPDLLLHSHTHKTGDKCVSPDGSMYDPRTPSYIDMVTQTNLDIPFGIVSTSGEDVSEPVYFPDYDAPLYGHDYISGVNDCFTIIQRYYWQEHGLKIPDFPREVGFYFEGNNHQPQHSRNLYEENYKSCGFYEVDIEDIQPSDVVLMAILSSVPTHGAIYLGNDKIAHHLTNRLSGKDTLARWRRKISKVLRWKES